MQEQRSHMFVHCINTCRVPREMLTLSTRPMGLVFKQLPWDLANVNNEKTCVIPIF